MASNIKPRTAYVGLGNMGSGMAKNICLKADLDKPLILYNSSPARTENLAAKLPSENIQIATELGTLVKSADIIFTSMGDDFAILETMETALKQDVRGKLFVDTSTVAGETSNQIDDMVREHGAEFVACPVVGAPAQCEAGQLLMLPAGPAASVEKVLPYCTGVMGRAVIPFQDHPPAHASNMKCIINSLLFNAIESVSEAQVLSEKSGIGGPALHQVISMIFPQFAPYHERMMNGSYYQSEHPPFSVDHARKDIRFAVELAKKNDVQLKALHVADDHYASVQKHMNGEKADMSSIYGAVRMESGLKFEA